MTRQTSKGEADQVDSAINRVLAAEAQAREAVEACRVRAAAILAEAEERAQQVAARADRSVRLAHRLADASVERALKQLLAHGPAHADAGLEIGAGGGLEAAVAALADEITGAGQ
jgi:F0F1-type ATP synthase membrane subunit b/b'